MATNLTIDHVIEFIVPIASAGIVAMALVQTIKAVVPLQRAFQSWALRKWLLSGDLGACWINACIGIPIAPKKSLSPEQLRVWFKGFADIGQWQSTDRVNSFFSQESKVLMDQLRISGEMAIDFPTTRTYSQFFTLLIERLGLDSNDVTPWLDFLRGNNKEAAPKADSAAVSDADRVRAAQAAKSLIQTSLRQHLAGIQLQLDSRWALWNQLIAVVVASTLLAIFSPIESKAVFNGLTTPLDKALLLTTYYALGGILAPFAKDLLNAFVAAKVVKG